MSDLRTALENIVTEYDRTHLRHDVSYETVADAIDTARAALAASREEPKECGICGDYSAQGVEVHAVCLEMLSRLASDTPEAET